MSSLQLIKTNTWGFDQSVMNLLYLDLVKNLTYIYIYIYIYKRTIYLEHIDMYKHKKRPGYASDMSEKKNLA